MDPLAALRDRVELLEERVLQLETAQILGGGYRGLRLTMSEYAVLSALMKDRPCTVEFLQGCIARASGREALSNNAAVIVSRVRQKLAALKPPVRLPRSTFGSYQLPQEDIAALRAIEIR